MFSDRNRIGVYLNKQFRSQGVVVEGPEPSQVRPRHRRDPDDRRHMSPQNWRSQTQQKCRRRHTERSFARGLGSALCRWSAARNRPARLAGSACLIPGWESSLRALLPLTRWTMLPRQMPRAKTLTTCTVLRATKSADCWTIEDSPRQRRLGNLEGL